MKLTFIELEANREEILASNSIADGLTGALRKICTVINGSNDYEEAIDEDEE